MRLALLALALISLGATTAEARTVRLGVRITPPLERPSDEPSLCPLLTLALGEHLWVGGGYELIQDHDAIWWKSAHEGHKPVVLSGIRGGVWYRGEADRNSATYGVGGIVTVANRVLSLEVKPADLDAKTILVELGADFTLGWAWDNFRLEMFATPAWSVGNISSPALHKNERTSDFNYRIGLELTWRIAS